MEKYQTIISITEKDDPFINGIKLPDYIDSILDVSILSIPVKFSFSVSSKQLVIFYTNMVNTLILTGKSKVPSIFDINIKYFSKSLDRDNKLNNLGI